MQVPEASISAKHLPSALTAAQWRMAGPHAVSIMPGEQLLYVATWKTNFILQYVCVRML